MRWAMVMAVVKSSLWVHPWRIPATQYTRNVIPSLSMAYAATQNVRNVIPSAAAEAPAPAAESRNLLPSQPEMPRLHFAALRSARHDEGVGAPCSDLLDITAIEPSPVTPERSNRRASLPRTRHSQHSNRNASGPLTRHSQHSSRNASGPLTRHSSTATGTPAALSPVIPSTATGTPVALSPVIRAQQPERQQPSHLSFRAKQPERQCRLRSRGISWEELLPQEEGEVEPGPATER
jgi:hypothetical protein